MAGVFLGRISDKKPRVNNRTKFASFLEGMIEGEAIVIYILREAEKRTLDQNSYYWAVVLPAIATISILFTVDDLHEIFKARYVAQISDEEKTTTGLTKRGFTEYIEKIKVWAAEHEIEIPEAA